jgi:hypothetical protein
LSQIRQKRSAVGRFSALLQYLPDRRRQQVSDVNRFANLERLGTPRLRK